MKNTYRYTSTFTSEYVPGLIQKERIPKMAKRTNTNKMETVLTNEAPNNVNNYVDVITSTPAKKPVARKAKAADPQKELDWRAVGMVREHQTAKARAIRKIDRIKAQYIYNVATAFLMGLAVGVMLTTWLH